MSAKTSATASLLGPSLLLGLLQGLTEFLPVSSSGHLVVGAGLLEFPTPSLVFEVILHVGTLVPVIWLYRADVVDILKALGRLAGRRSPAALWREDRGFRLALAVIVGTIPTALMGGLLQDLFEQLFANPRAVAAAFMVTGGILMLTLLRRDPSLREAPEPPSSHLTLTLPRALAIGVAQGLAITPGISRSGTTITAALLMGVERAMAARFSFLLSIPAIAGAALLHAVKATPVGPTLTAIYAGGAVAAAVSGYVALRVLVRLVRRGEMHWFAAYLWPLALAVLAYTFVR